MRISDFIEQSNRAKTAEPVVALMESAASDFGFDKFAYCALTRHGDFDAGLNPAPAVAHNFPDAWRDYYFANNYQTKDPVVLLAPEIARPFHWDDLRNRYKLEASQTKLMNQAAESGLNDGVGVPLHGPRGNVCLVTFAREQPQPDDSVELAKLEALATQFHAAYSGISHVEHGTNAALVLSLRERECLQWVAHGKSSWDISTILCISENTVNFHIKNALAKLDANSRTLAVVKAIRYGLISL
ncbi:MAG: LuxR family transcriptional regulator [Pseudomonadota bacterium]